MGRGQCQSTLNSVCFSLHSPEEKTYKSVYSGLPIGHFSGDGKVLFEALPLAFEIFLDVFLESSDLSIVGYEIF